MSFFSKTSAATSERLAAAVSALGAAGFQVAADAPIPAPEAVASAIESRIKAATDPLSAQLATAQARADGLSAALVAVGVSLPDLSAADFAPGASGAEAPAVAAVRGAIEATVARRSAKTIAATGHPAAVPVPRDDAADSATAGAPASAEEFLQRYEALSVSDPAGAQAYWRKHKSQFVR